MADKELTWVVFDECRPTLYKE